MMKLIALLKTIALVYLPMFLQAQELPSPVNVQSPNAASLGKYGDIDVSLFTGTANINLPIYQVSVRGIELNIDLTYDATGIRIDQHPGWVGQNWNLIVGGVITRTVNGYPDEFSFSGTNIGTNLPIAYPDQGYLYNYSDLPSEGEPTYEQALALVNGATNPKYFDYQPDIFTFNFMGISGKFFFGNDGQIKVQCEQNIQVLPIEKNNESYVLDYPLFEDMPIYKIPRSWKYSKVIPGFKIIDGNGTTFIFGFDPDAIEYSVDFFRQYYPEPDFLIANSWYLKKVIDKFGYEIFSFEYERGPFIASLHRTISSNTTTVVNNSGLMGLDCITPSNNLDHVLAIGGSLISPVYLKRIFSKPLLNNDPLISFEISDAVQMKYNYFSLLWNRYDELIGEMAAFQNKYYYVPFYYLQVANPYITDPLLDFDLPDLYTGPVQSHNFLENLKWKKLDKIKIFGAFGNINKRIVFNYNNNPNERLNLLGVDFFAGNNSTEKMPFSFEYKQFDQLPDYLSRREDHWGFFKGTQWPYPNHSSFSNYYSTREPNPQFLNIGMIEKIYYPTGGSTKFEFEPHDYSKIVSDSRNIYVFFGIAGGVRIKRIENYDNENLLQAIDYLYQRNYSPSQGSTVSSGVLSYKPKYYWPNWTVYVSPDITYSKSLFAINSIVPLGNSFGSHIGYSEVATVRSDGSYSVSFFNNHDNGHLDHNPVFSFYNQLISPYLKRSDNSIRRGKLFKQEHYNSNSDLIQKRKINFRTDYSNMYEDFVLGSNVTYHNLCPEQAESFYDGGIYKLYYYNYYPTSEETIDFFPEGEISQVVNYSYEELDLINNRGKAKVLLLRSQKIIGTNEEILKEFLYPVDEENDIANALKNGFRINEFKKETTVKINPSMPNNPPIPIGITNNTYKFSNNHLVNDKVLRSESDESGLEELISFDVYGSDAQLQQYTQRDGIPVSVLWGSDWGSGLRLHLRAIIKNATYEEVSSINNLGSGNYETSSALWNQIQQLVPQSFSTTYTHKPLVGVTSMTDPSGITIFYEYDSFGRLKAIRNHLGEYLERYDYHYKNQ